MQSRLASDVNDAEEAELRRLEGLPPTHGATPGNYWTPATGATTGGRQGWGSSSGEEGHQVPPPPFPHAEVAAEGAGAAAAAAAEAAGGNADGAGMDAMDAADRAPPPREVAPRPEIFPEEMRGLIEDQAANIKAQFDGRRGMSTYKTTWKEYEKYHMHRYGVPAPHCPYTGLLWLTVAQGTQFISYMARQNKTSSQASRPDCIQLLPCYPATLLPSCYIPLPCFPWLSQMSSARSALNYLLNSWHSIARIGDPARTPVFYARLTTKDAVS